jgi:hypothetical protein
VIAVYRGQTPSSFTLFPGPEGKCSKNKFPARETTRQAERVEVLGSAQTSEQNLEPNTRKMEWGVKSSGGRGAIATESRSIYVMDFSQRLRAQPPIDPPFCIAPSLPRAICILRQITLALLASPFVVLAAKRQVLRTPASHRRSPLYTSWCYNINSE